MSRLPSVPEEPTSLMSKTIVGGAKTWIVAVVVPLWVRAVTVTRPVSPSATWPGRTSALGPLGLTCHDASADGIGVAPSSSWNSSVVPRSARPWGASERGEPLTGAVALQAAIKGIAHAAAIQTY